MTVTLFDRGPIAVSQLSVKIVSASMAPESTFVPERSALENPFCPLSEQLTMDPVADHVSFVAESLRTRIGTASRASTGHKESDGVLTEQALPFVLQVPVLRIPHTLAPDVQDVLGVHTCTTQFGGVPL